MSSETKTKKIKRFNIWEGVDEEIEVPADQATSLLDIPLPGESGGAGSFFD